jgi:hypothetical protein
MAEVRTDWVTLQVADGTTMRACVARPQNGRPRAGRPPLRTVRPHYAGPVW